LAGSPLFVYIFDEPARSGLRKDHVLFVDSAAAWMATRKRTGARLSLCFTPEVDEKVAFASPRLVDSSMSVYIFTVALNRKLLPGQHLHDALSRQLLPGRQHIYFLVTIFQALKGDLESRASVNTSVRGHESKSFGETVRPLIAPTW
jgi:hypothetical protein